MTSASCRRLLRFSFVGALGIAVQVSVLAVLVAAGVNYLFGTGLAVESAILHNFLWHRRFTWSDRTQPEIRDFLLQFVRFHASNGLVSLLGNLLLMRLFAGSLKMPVLGANLGSISICFGANFLASDRWVFRR